MNNLPKIVPPGIRTWAAGSLLVLAVGCGSINQKNENNGSNAQTENKMTEFPPSEKFTRFVDTVSDTEKVWILREGDDMATLESKLMLAEGQPATLLCFWSTEAAALDAAKPHWPTFEATAVPLDQFMANYLTNMSVAWNYAGVDTTPARYATEADPLDLAIALCQILRKKGKDLEFSNFKDIDDLEAKARLSRDGGPK